MGTITHTSVYIENIIVVDCVHYLDGSFSFISFIVFYGVSHR